MEYEITEIQGQEYVTVFLDGANARTFPVDEANLDYVAFLRSTSK